MWVSDPAFALFLARPVNFAYNRQLYPIWLPTKTWPTGLVFVCPWLGQTRNSIDPSGFFVQAVDLVSRITWCGQIYLTAAIYNSLLWIPMGWMLGKSARDRCQRTRADTGQDWPLYQILLLRLGWDITDFAGTPRKVFKWSIFARNPSV